VSGTTLDREPALGWGALLCWPCKGGRRGGEGAAVLGWVRNREVVDSGEEAWCGNNGEEA